MNPISQRDPRWKDVVMGALPNRPTTIGDDGCAFTAMCMAFQNYGIDIRPDDLFWQVKQAGGVDSEGNVTWQFVERAVSVNFLYRDYTEKPDGQNPQLITTQAAYEKWKKLAERGLYPLLRVKLGASPKGNHWVVGLERDRIADPWTGDILPFRDRYGDPTLQVCGLSRFYANPNAADRIDLAAPMYKAFRMSEVQLPADLTEAQKSKLREVITYSREIFQDLT